MTGEHGSGTAAVPAAWTPAVLTVAPNGARKTKADHPALPLTPEECAATAEACRAAGAAMIHLHVRDETGGHSLSVSAYRRAIAAIRERLGEDDMVIQVTSEAVGIYDADTQMKMVRELRPEAVSLALKELYPDGGDEKTFAAFAAFLAAEGIAVQWILSTPEEVGRFEALQARGLIGAGAFRLYVLGRYSAGQISDPGDLLPFLQVAEHPDPWAVCAFGPRRPQSASWPRHWGDMCGSDLKTIYCCPAVGKPRTTRRWSPPWPRASRPWAAPWPMPVRRARSWGRHREPGGTA